MDHSLAKIKKSYGTGKFVVSDFKEIGKNVIFEKGVKVFNPQKIILGNNIYIGHDTIMKAYHFVEMEIEDNTWIGPGCYIHGAGGIKIGKSVSIGPKVSIVTSQNRTEFIDIPVIHAPLESKPVFIEEGADIGLGVVLLPGVKIGKGAIITAGAVVNTNVPEFEIWGGVPARKISNR